MNQLGCSVTEHDQLVDDFVTLLALLVEEARYLGDRDGFVATIVWGSAFA